jgi:hypothetical protein
MDEGKYRRAFQLFLTLLQLWSGVVMNQQDRLSFDVNWHHSDFFPADPLQTLYINLPIQFNYSRSACI